MFEKLLQKLNELFQLNEPELDFGIYRIMHAKSAEVTKFLEQDLLPQVKGALSSYHSSGRVEIESQLETAIKSAVDLGAEPEDTPKVQELRRQLAGLPDPADAEAEVYEHLYSFFRRYYSEGDFLSRRVYKQGVYAIPYEGEEVTLHWANKDQYYIKSSENLRSYTFRLRPNDASNPMRVHFQIVSASEEAHNNVKETSGKERRFQLSSKEPVVVNGEDLYINFVLENNADTQESLNKETVDTVFGLNAKELTPWLTELARLAPIPSDESRTLLAKHLKMYTTRNTFDYFIHKDLGTFLRRELDFYIKNEVMQLDDIEDVAAPKVEQYLSKIRAIRQVAGKIIDFLAQLEDFQKRIWLKKKFVTKTRYLISIELIPPQYFSEIASNREQVASWIADLGIDQIQETVTDIGFSNPITIPFLQQQSGLLVDTRYFSEEFQMRLLSEFTDLDQSVTGIAFHSDNYQALSLARSTFLGRVQCTFIDPPYNTGGDGFLYKDTYQHSSWLSMFTDRIALARDYLSDSGTLFFSLDEIEIAKAWLATSEIFGAENFSSELIWEKKKKPSFLHRNIGKLTDFILAFNKNSLFSVAYSIEKTTDGKMTPLNNAGNSSAVLDFPKNSVRFGCSDGVYRAKDMSAGNIHCELLDDITVIKGYNNDSFRMRGEWRYSQSKLNEVVESADELFISKEPFRPNHIKSGEETKKMKNFLGTNNYQMETNEDGTAQIQALFGADVFKNPKPEMLVRSLIKSVTYGHKDATVLDYFAGSGTTAHAVLNLNREDNGSRKFVLMEFGEHFESVLVPRIIKSSFSKEWKDGAPLFPRLKPDESIKPTMVRLIALESYEDSINNLVTTRPDEVDSLFGVDESALLREQYMLRYMLDVETRGSQSLLNVAQFNDPTAYMLRVKAPGSDETVDTRVDLLETFNWLIGLRVASIAAPTVFSATFKRDAQNRVRTDGGLTTDRGGPWWFRLVRGEMQDGRRVLVIWRKLSDDAEQNEAVLESWFSVSGLLDIGDFDEVYINGDTNLVSLRPVGAGWNVHLLEEHFHRLMFSEESE